MRTSITIATFLAASAGVASAAALPSPWDGSDTLFTITQGVIGALATAGATPVGDFVPSDYIGGGSGGAATAMAQPTNAAAKQQTGPMSRMIKNEGSVCTFNGGSAGSKDTSASGIVIGLDGVDIYSADVAGGQTSTACNGSADNTGTGLAYSGTTGVFAGPLTVQNWKWVLALVYGGLDSSQLVCSDNIYVSNATCSAAGAAIGTVCDTTAKCQIAPQACDSAQRKNLVANWSKLFEGGCANGSSACSATGVTGGALWHAFRRDDTSGTSDVFSSLIGISPSTSSSSNNGFGASPYCNSLNVDATNANTGCHAGIGGTNNLPHDQWIGPGGVPDPNASDATTNPGKHRRPPPGVWGDAPDPSQNTFTSADVLPTQQQDNDPIRRPCLGNGTTNSVSQKGEEVCNIDNALGLVLPMVDTDFFLTSASPGPYRQYPTNPTTNAFVEGNPVAVLNCPVFGNQRHAGECPNGDVLFFGSACFVPVDTSSTTVPGGTSQCVSSESTVIASSLQTRPPCAGAYGAHGTLPPANALDTFSAQCMANQGSPDGRWYNVQMYNGNPTSPAYIEQAIPALASTTKPTLDFAAGFNRIHQVETVLGASGGVGLAAGCQLVDMTDQIACLSQADPCSIGYAGDAGKAITGGGIANAGTSATGLWTGTTGPLLTFDSMRIAQVYPSSATVQLLGQPGEYQVARKLYFNSLFGFGNIAAEGAGGTTGDPTAADELTFAKFESNPAEMNAIVVANKEFTLGNQFAGDLVCSDGSFTCTGLTSGAACAAPGSGTCGAGVVDPQYCEDFNEQNICNSGAAPANVNGCASNPAFLCFTTQSNGQPLSLDTTGTATCTASGATAGLACGASGSKCFSFPGGPAGTGGVGVHQGIGSSTICGDGVRQAYEECDNGSVATPANGHATGNNNSDFSAGGCSLTCRCNNDFNITTGTCN
jgi:hypothetical protein